MTNSSEDTKPIPVSDYFESAYSLEGGFSFENLDYYADGILFPVHIGDLFPPPEDGDEAHLYRYKIMLKIGHGSYSTVWLALDLENQTHVALKFLSSGREEELSLYNSLSEADTHNGRDAMPSLLDSFHVGRKNVHAVLVFDVLIPWNFITPTQKKELNLESMVSQLTSGLSFLHNNNTTHGDLHQGNLALKLSPEFLFTEDDFLGELDDPELIPILPIPYSKERVRRPPPNYQPPKYLMSNNVFRDYVKQVLKKIGALSSARLQIIDLSNGYQDTLDEIPLTKRTVRAPESFIEELTTAKFHSGRPADIWALAVTIFELLSTPKESLYHASRDNKTALQNIITQLGSPSNFLPESWSVALSAANISLKAPNPPKEINGFSLLRGNVRRLYIKLLTDMLKIDPKERPSCEEVCLWLSKINETGERMPRPRRE